MFTLYTWCAICGVSLVISICTCIVYRVLHQVPATVPGEYYDKELEKMEKIVHTWIEEEVKLTSITIDSTGFNNTFLGTIATLNFKSLGIIPETASIVDNLLKDTETIRTLSHFLDLVRDIELHVDSTVLTVYKTRYFTTLLKLGPNIYTHNKKQVQALMRKYPWMWLLEYLSKHEIVMHGIYESKYVVATDASKAMQTGVNVTQFPV